MKAERMGFACVQYRTLKGLLKGRGVPGETSVPVGCRVPDGNMLLPTKSAFRDPDVKIRRRLYSPSLRTEHVYYLA